LHANIPNPFNPVTTIQYDVPAGGADVNIAVFDVSGRRVRTLVNEHRNAGRFSAQWNGADDRGGRVASGVYFYRMRAGDFARQEDGAAKVARRAPSAG
jgi:flagellar hook assembly protein FlgD